MLVLAAGLATTSSAPQSEGGPEQLSSVGWAWPGAWVLIQIRGRDMGTHNVPCVVMHVSVSHLQIRPVHTDIQHVAGVGAVMLCVRETPTTHAQTTDSCTARMQRCRVLAGQAEQTNRAEQRLLCERGSADINKNTCRAACWPCLPGLSALRADESASLPHLDGLPVGTARSSTPERPIQSPPVVCSLSRLVFAHPPGGRKCKNEAHIHPFPDATAAEPFHRSTLIVAL